MNAFIAFDLHTHYTRATIELVIGRRLWGRGFAHVDCDLKPLELALLGGVRLDQARRE